MNQPILVGGIGNINFGTQYRQGNRVYDSRAISMAITANAVGNAGGYTYLYLVEIKPNEKLHSCIKNGSHGGSKETSQGLRSSRSPSRF